MQLAAKIRKDFLKVDRFWRTFLANHSKYNPIPLDQLPPIRSPGPVVSSTDDNSSYLINHHNGLVNGKIDVAVQTFDINGEPSRVARLELHGLKRDTSVSIEEIKTKSFEVTILDSEANICDNIPMDSDTKDRSPREPTLEVYKRDDTIVKRKSDRKYPKRRNIQGTDPIRGKESLFQCMEVECSQGECKK